MNIKQIWSIVPNLLCTADVISYYPFLFCRNTSFRRYYTAIAAAAAFFDGYLPPILYSQHFI